MEIGLEKARDALSRHGRPLAERKETIRNILGGNDEQLCGHQSNGTRGKGELLLGKDIDCRKLRKN